MFDKLRLKFILINMSLLTVVFVAIFGTIFTITNMNIENDINRELEGLMRDGRRPKPFYTYMVIDVDKSKNLINVMTPFQNTISKDVLKEGILKITENEKPSSKIEIGGTKYSYLKQSIFSGQRIVLLDRTYQQNTVLQLLKSFIVVGAISLIILLIISIYLTNKTLNPVKETFKKQKQFIDDASHELKTPLTIIKTNTSLVLSNPEDTVQNQSKWINYINLQVDRMSELINEMLTLAKLDTAENNIEFHSINISKTIQGMMLAFDAIIFENKINLEDNVEKDIVINGNEEGIKNLFSILMDNAIKHTNKNGTISVSLFNDRNKIKVIVKNTGDGIAHEHLEKIFERFYRVDDSRIRETGGYGLGLSIARSIVEQYNGKIYAKSILGEDTSFIVELPY
ncbi:sensor histidine kinase [Romboutsia sp.]|uniref:sensor histidine kinase n=1 Tax=Romboutsia sp. TaxID=1965302 RepID=UPI003F38BF68